LSAKAKAKQSQSNPSRASLKLGARALLVHAVITRAVKLIWIMDLKWCDLTTWTMDMKLQERNLDFINPKECGDKSLSQKENSAGGEGGGGAAQTIVLSAWALAPSCQKPTAVVVRDGARRSFISGVEMEMKGAPFCIGAGELLQGRTVVGSLFGGVKPKTDIPNFASASASAMLEQELQLDDFITHEVSLNQAFELLMQGKSLRCLIWMDKPTNRIKWLGLL
ncbi:Alcohol dehydrogenase-like 2, partial [Nymphaea thermarum]